MTKLSPNMKSIFLKITVNTLLIAGFCMSVQAQKLKDVQEVSMTAPANIKVDGRNTEWNDTFQAENKRTSIFYTISNDDKNLYLVIKSTDVANNTKILAGGITLAINTEGKKREKESITLTYPLINRPAQGGGQGGGRRQMGAVAGFAIGRGGNGSSQTPEQRDSMMAVMQKRQLSQVKEIKINGFKKTTDTLISIYNDLGIKAYSSIGNDKAFFYELAIPLEELGISKDAPKEFAYNIKVNGLQLQGLDGGGRGGFGGNRGGGGGGNFGPRGSGIDFQALTSPTDFWGKYTLK